MRFVYYKTFLVNDFVKNLFYFFNYNLLTGNKYVSIISYRGAQLKTIHGWVPCRRGPPNGKPNIKKKKKVIRTKKKQQK